MDDIKPTTPWIPGTGETSYMTRSGIRVLYCWSPRTREKAWLNCDSDTFMSDDEAIRAHNNSTPFKRGDIA